jgi:hypothetical protein
MEMRLEIASKNLFRVFALIGVPVFLIEVYRADASTITGATSRVPVDYKALYSIYDQQKGDTKSKIKGTVVLHPLKLLKVDRAKTYRDLLDEFPGFKVIDKNRKPDGEFNVRRYEACPTGTELCVMSIGEFQAIAPGINNAVTNKGSASIGALFLVDFILPTGNLSSETPNFVQMVQTSYSPNCSGATDVYKVDTQCSAKVPATSTTPEIPKKPLTPLYYAGFDSSLFYDRPEDPYFYGQNQNKDGSVNDEYFNAELFAAKVVRNPNLVSNTVVTLYDGISWGWRSKISRTPLQPGDFSSALPPSPDAPRTARRRPCPAGMPIHSCIIFGYDYGGNGYAQVPLTEIAPSQSDQPIQLPSPPPPSSQA